MLIGEALVGTGDEVAHIDVVIGDKDGHVGEAFVNSLSNLSAGHTPLLAVIRPNLPPKPFTLIVPKVTVQNLEDAAKIFGPAQAAVAKAVADGVEEGIIPEDKIDEWVIICSVFVHPNAKDYRRIYIYNYGATKLALKRALAKYPPLQKILYEKDRAMHPIMGFRVPRLWRPPYIQIHFDIPSLETVKKVILQIPKSDRIIFEIGVPVIQKYGLVATIKEVRDTLKNSFLIANLGAPSIPKVEVDTAFEETADAVIASGVIRTEKLDSFIYEARRLGIYAIIDAMDSSSPIELLEPLKEPPDGIILHYDEKGKEIAQLVEEIRHKVGKKILVTFTGTNILPETVASAIASGADILRVGRYVTQSRDVERAVREFLTSTADFKVDIDLLREHVE